MSEYEAIRPNFITQIIDRDLALDKYGGRPLPRFSPPPNRLLHLWHTKSLCLHF